MSAKDFVKSKLPDAEVRVTFTKRRGLTVGIFYIFNNGSIIGKGDTDVKAWKSAKGNLTFES